jgi:hypothetical protein
VSRVGVGALAAATLLAGCGASARTGTATSAAAPATLGAGTPPPGWHVERTTAGLTLAYPADWRALPGDKGTLSAAQRSGGAYLGYLNVTPRQAAERRSDWAAFRNAHNREEGDRAVRLLASVAAVNLAAGPASCVKDAYTTITGAHFVELACLTEGAHPVVVLGAAPPQLWRSQQPLIVRAISSATA